jgi:hypothetical protein
MSTETTIDTGATPSVASATTAPSNVTGEPQGSVPASEDTSATPAKQEGQEPDKPSRRESRAFATLRRENRDLARQLGRLEAALENLRPAPTGEDGKPQPKQTLTPEQQAFIEADNEAAAAIRDRLEEDGEGIEGFDKVMKTITAGNFPMSRVMRDYLGESEAPALVAKWLADNPSEARRIQNLSEPVAVRALERAEAKLSKAEPKPAPRSTQAPAPPQTVSGGAAAPQAVERMSYEDLKKQVAKWGRS